MPVRPVLRLPDHFLKQRAVPVGRVDDAARALAVDLVDTMRASPACVGIAATQLGVGVRAFAVDVTGHKKARSCHGEIVLFDPEVLLAHGPVVAREGCMSVPDLTGDVARASSLLLRGITVDGGERVIDADAFEARALLHELDHLDGLLFLDRVSSHESLFRRKVYK
ncbi:MAG: peptide deformylase [Acidimicrobiia bacterium]|nr:peptide deformylase [Acidimicrobiia bacterium]